MEYPTISQMFYGNIQKALNKEIYFSLPYIQQEIPVGVVFIALGFVLKDPASV